MLFVAPIAPAQGFVRPLKVDLGRRGMLRFQPQQVQWLMLCFGRLAQDHSGLQNACTQAETVGVGHAQ